MKAQPARFSAASRRFESINTTATSLLLAGLLTACGDVSSMAVAIEPSTVALPRNGRQDFTAQVSGVREAGVSWSLKEGTPAGTITEDGQYIAPPYDGVFHIIAISQADHSKRGIAVVTVRDIVVTVSIFPRTLTLMPGQKFAFAANVSGATNKSVVWSVEDGGGTINDDGEYTAPSSLGSYSITAISRVDPSRSDTVTVTVEDPVVRLSRATAQVFPTATEQFSANVTGARNTAVTWSVVEDSGGTVTSNGLYTAPRNAGTFHVKATSVANPARTATATVIVPYVNITVRPDPAVVDINQNLALTATVLGLVDGSVRWEVQDWGGGRITSSGVYTAPEAGGTFRLLVTSLALPSFAVTFPIAVNGPRWVPTGPPGGSFWGFAAAQTPPFTFYAVSQSNSYRSINGGSTWSQLPHAPCSQPIFDPSSSSVMYCPALLGLAKSTDAGATWSPLPHPGSDNNPVNEISLARQAPSTLYAATNEGVFKSTDGGMTWMLKDIGSTSHVITHIYVTPRAPFEVYASSLDPPRLFASTDAGETWSQIPQIPPPTDTITRIRGGIEPSIVYVASTAGLERTFDRGLTWQQLFSGAVGDVVQDQREGHLFIQAGQCGDSFAPCVLESIGGGNWSVATRYVPGIIRSIELDSLWGEPSFLAVTNHRIERVFWGDGYDLSSGVTAYIPYAIAIDPISSSSTYVGTSAGCFKSPDDGKSWNALNNEIAFCTAIAISAVVPNTIYAAGDTGIHKSTDGGLSWRRLNRDVLQPSSLAIDPVQPTTLYAGGYNLMQKSTNGGVDWVRIQTGLPPVFEITSVVLRPSSTSTLYAAERSGVFKTVDGGAHWLPANYGLTSVPVYALAINDKSDQELYAATLAGIFKTSDGAGTWSLVSAVTGGAFSLAIDPINTSTVYAGLFRAAVLKTSDGGTTWRELRVSSEDIYINSLAINPKAPSIVYAGTGGFSPQGDSRGILKTLSGGE